MITAADRRELNQIAAQLRALADDIAAGRLPAKGTATDLGRRVEKVLDKRRVKPRPGARAAQIRSLAAELAKRTGVEQISTTYDERRREWMLSWGNGPTTDTMFEIVDELRAQGRYPQTEGSLTFSRGAGYRAEVAVLLQHLEQHGLTAEVREYARRRRIDFANGSSHYNTLDTLANQLTYKVDYPERLLDEAMARRVDALYRLDPRVQVIHYEPTPAAWLAFGDQLLADGWPAARDQLDQHAAA